jgi:SAM-dependent methyltransferase
MSRTVKSGYNSIASRYIATRSEKSPDVQLLTELVKRLPKQARVLDAGCGAGVPITRILSRSFKVTGVDFSEKQIELARRLVPRANFLKADMTRLTFPESSFDAICSFYAIIHIPRRKHRQLLRDFHNMLKPQGLALLCLGADDIKSQVEENYLGHRMYWSHYSSRVNLAMVKRSGFEIILSRIVKDSTNPGSNHLFVLAMKR